MPEAPGFGVISLGEDAAAHLAKHTGHILARAKLSERIQAFAEHVQCLWMLTLRLGDDGKPTIGKTQPPAISDRTTQRNAFFPGEARFVKATESQCAQAQIVQRQSCEARIANRSEERRVGKECRSRWS